MEVDGFILILHVFEVIDLISEGLSMWIIREM
jgi:hypothetical protein